MNSLEERKVTGVNEHLDYQSGFDRQLLVDDTGTVTYFGRADTGVGTSDAVWSIKRVNNSTGAKTWSYVSPESKGNSNFTHIWDNRTSLSYS